jgi:hypothetical protein
MKLELKNVKHAAFASQETHCFEATLYVDGKRFATVSNEGHGGCNYEYPIAPFTDRDIKKLNEKIAAEYPPIVFDDYDGLDRDNDSMPQDLDYVVGGMVNDHLLDKEIKRALRRILFIESPDSKDVYTFGAAKDNKNLIRTKVLKKYPQAIILNDLPLEEVRNYWS